MPRWLMGALAALALLFLTFAQWQAWRQYAAGEVMGDATQVFDVMLSHAAQGEALLYPHSGNHYFASHVRLFLIPVVWLYRLHDNIWTFLTVLNAGLALAIPALGALAWAKLRSAALVLAVCVFFAAAQFTGSLRFALHPESLLLAPWFLVFLGLERRRMAVMVTGAALLLTVKEDQAVWLLMTAAWAAAFRRAEWRFPGVLAGIGAAALVAFAIIHHAVPQPGPAVDTGLFWIERFGADTNSPVGVAIWFLTNPLVLLERWLVNPSWLLMIFNGGVLCLLGWRPLLLAVPPALLLFAMASPIFGGLQFYYNYLVFPFLIYALVEGLEKGLRWEQVPLPAERRPAIFAAFIGLLAIVHALVPTRTNGWHQAPALLPEAGWQRAELGRAFVQQSVEPGQEVLVATHYHLGAWVPHGRQTTTLRARDRARAELMLLDVRRVSPDLGRADYEALLRGISEGTEPWELVDQAGDFALLRRVEE